MREFVEVFETMPTILPRPSSAAYNSKAEADPPPARAGHPHRDFTAEFRQFLRHHLQASPGADVGAVPAQMWAQSRRRCGRSPGADVGGVPAQMWAQLWAQSRRRCGRVGE